MSDSGDPKQDKDRELRAERDFYEQSPDNYQHNHLWKYSLNQLLWVCWCGAHRDRFSSLPLKRAEGTPTKPNKENK